MENSKYQNSKVYKIIDNTENQYYYIGSTTSTLTKRLYNHKREYEIHPEQKKNKYFNSINWNVRIILINEFKLENRDQLRREEDNIIKTCLNDPKCLNMRREIMTAEENRTRNIEYYNEHKQEDKPRRIQYNIDHREHKAEYDQEYRKNNIEKIKSRKGLTEVCECGLTYTHVHKMRHLQTKEHAKRLLDQTKTQEQQEEIEYNKKFFTCGCGVTGSKYHLSRHELTKKHQAWMALHQQN